MIRRREFITLLGGAAAWPVAARAQQPERMRRIGVLMSTSGDDPESQARLMAFTQGLQQLGWSDGRYVRIETRWALGETARVHRYAAELIELSPDVIVTGGRVASVVPAIEQAGRRIPIVFVQAVDPVGSGYIASLASPRRQRHRIHPIRVHIELLKEVAPRTTRAAVLRESGQAGVGQWAVIQTVASSLAVELTPIDIREPTEIERAVAAFAREPNGGLIIAVSSAATVHRDLIIALATKHRLPAIYPYRYFVGSGGLASYGPNLIEQYGRAATYVDRILKGEKPADLPVQSPTKYELAVNLKTAKALGLEVPPTLLARADEIIE